jgi:hypothetical protein
MNPSHDRLIELLAERATQGLGPEQSRELQELLMKHPEVKADALDLAAAAIDSALSDPPAAPPASLTTRLNAAADQFLAEAGARVAGRIAPQRSAMWWLGWLAAAACLAFALFTRFPRPADPTAQRFAMLRTPGIATWTWNPFNLPPSTVPPVVTGVQGDVVWDEAAQRGYMRFTGLPVNDATKEQYQVWLVDSRGLDFRISGGVFNAASTGELVVPITPALRTRGVGAVAVTVEPAGGVVVSDMTRRVVIATPPKN